MSDTSVIDIVNVVFTLLLTFVSTAIAIISLILVIRSEKNRADEIKKEEKDYLEIVDFILNKSLEEIKEKVSVQINTLHNKADENKLIYIKKSLHYNVQEVKSRLHIICSFEFNKMDNKRLNDLYEVRTLVSGIYNTFYGYERNLNDNVFTLEMYERYLSDTLNDIQTVQDSFSMENKN